MSTVTDLLLNRIESSLDAVTRAPRSWGSPESLELQTLLLLEIRTFLMRPHARAGELRAAYDRFIAERFEDAPATPLYCILRDTGRQTELPALLQTFREEIVAGLPQEDLFEHYDLVLEFALNRGEKLPSFSKVCSYYENIQQAIRSVAGPQTRDKNAKNALTAATEYPIPEIRVIKENGVGPRVQVPLTQVQSKQVAMAGGVSPEDRIKDALVQFGRVADWANGERPSAAELQMMFPAQVGRKKLASQLLKIVPEQGMEAIRVGGKMLNDGPITFLPGQASRIVPVLQEGQRPKPFDVSGVVRAIDLDQHWFRLNYANGSRKCWVTLGGPNLEKARDAIDRPLRVVGAEYRAPNHHPFVVVSRVN